MTAQLILIDDNDTSSSWKIPEATRRIGRKGIAEAREVLRRIPRHTDDADHGPGPHDPGHHHPAAA